ncbi:unnamed protein product [Ranitomeya imitator]|uniref:Uncharacterized protein n=2 Tax=Ranitomeya imitator TaxID=111125 RepID=A0ABN9MQD0_9NEOB|nr:unnamed protein product [Ranitomeya imitator]
MGPNLQSALSGLCLLQRLVIHFRIHIPCVVGYFQFFFLFFNTNLLFQHRPNDYGIPMEVEVTYIQDSFLTNDILHDMALLVEFYKGGPDQIALRDNWNEDNTFLDKIKGSLATRVPKDAGYEAVIDQIYRALT